MSPHVKRVALGGSVFGLVSLLVLGAVAVAHRDARNAEGDPSQPLPEYAQQAIEPLAAPPGMIDASEPFSAPSAESQYADDDGNPRRFPDANLSPDPHLQASYSSDGISGAPDSPPAALAADGSTEHEAYASFASPPPAWTNPQAGGANQPAAAELTAASGQEPQRQGENSAAPSGYELSGLPPLPGFAEGDAADGTPEQALVPSTASIGGKDVSDSPELAPDGFTADQEDPAVVPAADWQADSQSGSNVVPAAGFGWPGPAQGAAPPAERPSSEPPAAPSLPQTSAVPLGAPGPASLPPGQVAPGFATPGASAANLRSSDGPPGFLQPTGNPASSGPARGSIGSNAAAGSAGPPVMPLPTAAPEGGDVGSFAAPAAPAGGSRQDFPSGPGFPSLPPSAAADIPATSPAAGAVAAPSASPSPASDGFSGSPAAGGVGVSAGVSQPTAPAFGARTSDPASMARSTMVSLNRDRSTPETFAPSISDSGASLLPNDTPGARTIDGVQAPRIEVLKQAPAEIQVGRAATLTISIKNVGPVEVADVIVHDAVPQGAVLSATNPPAQELPGGRLMWSIAKLPPGGQHSLSMEIVPEVEGEMGSVATVAFSAQAGFRTVSTLPKLRIDQQADDSVLIGEKAKIRINVTNDGTGVARDVSIEEDVPPGLGHQQGGHLGMQLDDLAPGQTRTVDLELEAKEPGVQQNTVRLVASNADPVESTVEIEVVAPDLGVEVDGPSRRYLEREANYKVSITNRGTAAARNVELIAYLPRGLQYASAGNHGEYLPQEHAVIWSLDELAASSAAVTDMTLMPVEEGEFVIRLHSRSDRSNSEPTQKQVRIEGQSELEFLVEDDNDPIEIDGETTYSVRLNNIGTRADSDVQVVVELPRDCELRGVAAPVEYTVAGNQLLFSPIASIKPKEQLLIRFTAALRGEGTQMVRVSVKSGLRPVAVVKEESTQVYSDR